MSVVTLEQGKDTLIFLEPSSSNYDVVVNEKERGQEEQQFQNSSTTFEEAKERQRQQQGQEQGQEQGEPSKTSLAPQGAINPETGEINWDCPCLAKAIAPPCGEAFKRAFSCFVYSQANPRGEECMDAFVAMNDCYLEHPEIYAPSRGEEDQAERNILKDDEDYDEHDVMEKTQSRHDLSLEASSSQMMLGNEDVLLGAPLSLSDQDNLTATLKLASTDDN